MIRYIKVNDTNIITDMISFKYPGYIKVENNIPDDIFLRIYRYKNNEIILDEELLNECLMNILETYKEEENYLEKFNKDYYNLIKKCSLFSLN